MRTRVPNKRTTGAWLKQMFGGWLFISKQSSAINEMFTFQGGSNFHDLPDVLVLLHCNSSQCEVAAYLGEGGKSTASTITFCCCCKV